MHIIDCIAVKKSCLHLVAENTLEALKTRSVLNIDKYFREQVLLNSDYTMPYSIMKIAMRDFQIMCNTNTLSVV